MPNPASVFCVQKGNKLEIRTAADGSQSGICVFPDGSACDEWAYFRGECGPAAQSTPTPAMAVEPTLDPDWWWRRRESPGQLHAARRQGEDHRLVGDHQEQQAWRPVR